MIFFPLSLNASLTDVIVVFLAGGCLFGSLKPSGAHLLAHPADLQSTHNPLPLGLPVALPRPGLRVWR